MPALPEETCTNPEGDVSKSEKVKIIPCVRPLHVVTPYDPTLT